MSSPGRFPFLRDITPVVLPIIERCPADQRELIKNLVAEDPPEPVLADEAHAGMLVQDQTAWQVAPGIVAMDEPQAAPAGPQTLW